jgi:hypothetical protein
VPTFFVAFERGQLIFKDHLGIIEQPPDQRRLAVVHRPAGDEPQHRLVLVGFEIGVDVFGNERVGDVDRLVLKGGLAHQKYPAAFSLPCPHRPRPCRWRGPGARWWW